MICHWCWRCMLKVRRIFIGSYSSQSVLTITKLSQNKRAAAQIKMAKDLSLKHIQWQKDQHLDQREVKSQRYNQQCEKKWNGPGQGTSTTSRMPDGSRVSPRGDHMTRETTRVTSQAVEIRPGQILERNDMAEDSTRQTFLETACWGLSPTTGHYGCQNNYDDEWINCSQSLLILIQFSSLFSVASRPHSERSIFPKLHYT